MLKYLRSKISRHKAKRTFKEHGYKVKDFEIPEFGKVQYAQWLHPFETEKFLTESNINFYKKLAAKGGMIIDIGAHTGDTTVPMALAVGKGGLVLGLEPNQFVYKILEKNSELNQQYTNIKPLQFAATDKDGKFTFNYSDASFCNGGFLSKIKNKKHRHNYTLDVEGKDFQKFLFQFYSEDLERLQLLKIDAEGYDKEIIKNIPEIISNCKPNILVECYKHLTSDERNELFNALDKHGYNLYRLDNFDTLQNLTRLKLENMSDQKHFEILALHQSKQSIVLN